MSAFPPSPMISGPYQMDREDLEGEVNLLLGLMSGAREFLAQGDVKAAQMVLEVWWLHACGHSEVEEDRPIYECRMCQDPATKRMLAKWAARSHPPPSPRDGTRLKPSEEPF
jgi:hypothetical protein